jgi:hypothetical protein
MFFIGGYFEIGLAGEFHSSSFVGEFHRVSKGALSIQPYFAPIGKYRFGDHSRGRSNSDGLLYFVAINFGQQKILINQKQRKKNGCGVSGEIPNCLHRFTSLNTPIELIPCRLRIHFMLLDKIFG